MKMIVLCFFSLIFPVLSEEITFSSQFFTEGQLIYSDDFDGSFQKEQWEIRQQTQWEVKDGFLLGRPSPKEFQETMISKGDKWHGGFGPIIRLNNIPSKFVCHMRLKYVGDTLPKNRPLLDIGHHVNSFMFGTKGPYLKLLKGKVFKDLKVPLKLNEWYDIVIEFEEGRLLFQANGKKEIFEHEQITMKGYSQFTFKAIESPESQLLFDYVKLWEAK